MNKNEPLELWMFKNHKMKRRIKEYLFGENGPKPFMSDDEIICILKYLKNDMVMLEWGSGSSTLYYPKYVKQYHSIEHMMSWYRLIRLQLQRYPNIKDKVKLHYVPTNLEIKTIGDDERKYYDYIKHINNIGIKKFDAILVDGGARDYCAIESIPYMDKTSILFFHDYFLDKYKYCHRIEEYFEIVDSVDSDRTLAVMRLKDKEKN